MPWRAQQAHRDEERGERPREVQASHKGAGVAQADDQHGKNGCTQTQECPQGSVEVREHQDNRDADRHLGQQARQGGDQRHDLGRPEEPGDRAHHIKP